MHVVISPYLNCRFNINSILIAALPVVHMLWSPVSSIHSLCFKFLIGDRHGRYFLSRLKFQTKYEGRKKNTKDCLELIINVDNLIGYIVI